MKTPPVLAVLLLSAGSLLAASSTTTTTTTTTTTKPTPPPAVVVVKQPCTQVTNHNERDGRFDRDDRFEKGRNGAENRKVVVTPAAAKAGTCQKK